MVLGFGFGLGSGVDRDQLTGVELHLVRHRRRLQVAGVVVVESHHAPSLPIHAHVALDASTDSEAQQPRLVRVEVRVRFRL